MKLFLQIYSYFASHRWLCWTLLAVITAALALCALRLHYSEDILAFLPFDERQKQQFQIYQQQANAQTITIIVEGGDIDGTIDALELFADNFEMEDIVCRTTVDLGQIGARTDSLSRLLPFLVTEADYARIDSVLTEEYIRQRLLLDRSRLMIPQSGILQPLISTDPLGLFADYVTPPAQAGAAFDIIDGYIFSADHSRAIAFIESPFGSNESGRNALLADAVDKAIASTLAQLSDPAHIAIRAVGSPVISVGNARQIKRDTVMAVSVAFVLIALLLVFSLRRKRDIFYMLLTVAFGMLFAVGIMGLVTDEISLIVLGISSVIIGIAVNYPLHVIVHRDLRPDMPTTLREVLSPLVIGNITTVAAFLCLVPLKAKALHDLGLFSALMLVGTILFSVIFLPQLIETGTASAKPVNTPSSRFSLIDRLAALQPHQNKYIALAVLLLTVVFAFFSPKLSFDSDLRHINYMTAEQKADIDYFLEAAGHKNTQTVYVAREITDPQPCMDRWNSFWQAHQPQLMLFRREAMQAGFREQAFLPFLSLADGQWLASEPGIVVRQVEVPQERIAEEEARLQQLYPDAQVFDIQTLNSSVTGNMSSNFDYIGLACSLIVLLFLCINLRSLCLGLIAFTPMLIAWVWILGAMYLLDIHFNIVNIILATFIFGQGDDYTIFITEGLVYEDKTGKPILTAYKRSIILSALLMFVGIGVLVIARHPAMHSLGVVTILGMAAVVLMAYIVPPVLFKYYKLFYNRLHERFCKSSSK